MQWMTKLALGLFILSLPATYFSSVPAILSFLLFISLKFEEKMELQIAQEEIPEAIVDSVQLLEKKYQLLNEEVRELRSQVNALNIRAGLNIKN